MWVRKYGTSTVFEHVKSERRLHYQVYKQLTLSNVLTPFNTYCTCERTCASSCSGGRPLSSLWLPAAFLGAGGGVGAAAASLAAAPAAR